MTDAALDRTLPVLAPLAAHEARARALGAAFAAGEAGALDLVHRHLPRLRDPVVRWKPRELTPAEVAATPFGDDDARLAVAQHHGFRDWDALAAHVTAVQAPGSPVRVFELAVEAVVGGDLEALGGLLAGDPALVRARSARVTCFDPPVHRATLLHYVAANGVEDHRQRTPANAIEIARRLLAAGAEPDALAAMYGGEYAPLAMLVSSEPPAAAGLQVPLVHLLLDAGAAVDGAGSGHNLMTALLFGFVAAAEALAARGATLELATAAGLGRAGDVARLLPAAPPRDRQAALALAAQLGHPAIVRVLLDAGEDPDRFNLDGMHAHTTPLHQAALAGHLDVVRVLVERGARLDQRDRIWQATPLGWARHGGRHEVAALLAAAADEGGGG